LVLAALLLAGLVGLGLVRLAAASSSRSAAQAAADAAALAGAADGEGAARHLAAVNGAEVVTYRSDGLDVEVVVRRRGVTARARARWVLSAERGRRLRWWDRHPV
jgi:outer membrane lipoprotein SlyB